MSILHQLSNFPVQYTAMFSCKIFCFETQCLWVHDPTHDLCFESRIRKIGIPCKYQFYYMKAGYKGVYITRTCHPDARYEIYAIISTHRLWAYLATSREKQIFAYAKTKAQISFAVTAILYRNFHFRSSLYPYFSKTRVFPT